MTLLKWQPYRDLANVQRQLNRFFEDDLFGKYEDQDMKMANWHPATDILETKDEYVFKVELPGIAKEDVFVELNDNMLTIKGERKEEKDIDKEAYHRCERCSGSFSRSFNVPKNVDNQKISATMKNGILELKVPKAEQAKPKEIPIQIH